MSKKGFAVLQTAHNITSIYNAGCLPVQPQIGDTEPGTFPHGDQLAVWHSTRTGSSKPAGILSV